MPFSETFSNAISALIRSNTPIPAFGGANRYLALHTVNPTKTCLVGELSTANYSRVLVNLDELAGANGNDISNESVIVFPLASGTVAQPIAYFSFWDSLANGTPISYGKLTTPVNWTSGSSLSLAINALIQTVRNKVVE